mmetsp:Transcript_3520/g.6783  ORF Transcript_3520/g.6783 Transcript_3520/m.6783 type:complete len:107 (+) Transcript_3520:259-579(+)
MSPSDHHMCDSLCESVRLVITEQRVATACEIANDKFVSRNPNSGITIHKVHASDAGRLGNLRLPFILLCVNFTDISFTTVGGFTTTFTPSTLQYSARSQARVLVSH